jgi:hypothetical protein
MNLNPVTEHQVIATKVIFDHPWARIVIDTLEYQGNQRPYFYLESPVEAVATVGLTQDGEVILTRQSGTPWAGDL